MAEKMLPKMVKSTSIYIQLGSSNAKLMKPPDMPLNAYLKEQESHVTEVLGCGPHEWSMSYFNGETMIKIVSPRDVQTFFQCVQTAKNGSATLYINASPAMKRTLTGPSPPPVPAPPVPTPVVPSPTPVVQSAAPVVSAPPPSMAQVKSSDNGVVNFLKETALAVSEGFRDRWKALLDRGETSEEALAKASAELDKRGYHGFKSSAIVWEELGISGETWIAQVNQLVGMGLPEGMGETLRLAIRNKRGSKKSAYASLWFETPVDGMSTPYDGVPLSKRLTYYAKFQIIPVGEEFDVVVALNQNECFVESAKKNTTDTSGSQAELAFKKFIRMDSEVQFKEEVQQFM
eukprot:CAMPEP_0172723376 /NCGR_PEP_ID=MMETSP1074-20121228/83600_1 /TAXON_ID=2916 /ORGANISM="Ceratium fusus, Strain PA161109" /LENGTH=345 /DNA_ID=CAMNT_0013549599 /DNA_START=197 /DNA_END=1234 /DNA_ORIENTATION=+